MAQNDNRKQNNVHNDHKHKLFINQESLLTTLIAQNNHVRCIHNIILAFIFVFTLATIGDYISNPAKFHNDYKIFAWNMGDFMHTFRIWTIMNGSILFLLYSMVLLKNYLEFRRFLFWMKSSKFNNVDIDKLKDSFDQNEHLKDVSSLERILFHCVYVTISTFGIMVFSSKYILDYDLKLAASFSIMLEMARLLMKAHSFYIEKKDLHLEKEELKKVLKQMNDSSNLKLFFSLPSCPKWSCLLYFLFAPTLIYQDSYPRTNKIRWNVLLNHSIQMLAGIFLSFIAIFRFLVDNFSKTGLEPFQTKNFFRYLNQLFLFGMVMFALSFYCLFHLWHNISAELMRFGDRHYYDDWWNSLSLKEYYRKWNLIVQHWLFRYIYQPIHSYSKNRALSNYSVIFISAIIHEYIIGIVLRCFIPVLFINFAAVGYLYYLMTKNMKQGPASNIVFMLNSILGWGMISMLYSMEYYSRINCPSQTSSKTLDIFIPRMITCIKTN